MTVSAYYPRRSLSWVGSRHVRLGNYRPWLLLLPICTHTEVFLLKIESGQVRCGEFHFQFIWRFYPGLVPRTMLAWHCTVFLMVQRVLRENFPSWLITPMNLCGSVMLEGGGISLILDNFSESADMPDWLMIWSRKIISLCQIHI